MTSWIQSNPRKSKTINVNAVMHCMLSFIILKRTKELTLKTKPTVLNKFISNVHIYIYNVSITCLLHASIICLLHASITYLLHASITCLLHVSITCLLHVSITCLLHVSITCLLHVYITCLHYVYCMSTLHVSITCLHLHVSITCLLHIYIFMSTTCLHLHVCIYIFLFSLCIKQNENVLPKNNWLTQVTGSPRPGNAQERNYKGKDFFLTHQETDPLVWGRNMLENQS